MTVLDTSVAHYPVLMELDPNAAQTAAAPTLAPGYHFEPWDERYREPWVRLHVVLGQLDSFDAGLAYFEKTYEAYPSELQRQMLLVCDGSGKLAGTSSVWRGEHFGETRLRVHWVGVDPAHQRRGLARSLMLRTIALYNELESAPAALRAEGIDPAPLYLTTQTESWVAIGMYLRLGFDFYRGPKPPRFDARAATWNEDCAEAERIARAKLDTTSAL